MKKLITQKQKLVNYLNNMSAIGIDENGDIDIGSVVTGFEEIVQRIHIGLATIKGSVNWNLDLGIDIMTAFENFSADFDNFSLFVQNEITRILVNINEVQEIPEILIYVDRNNEDEEKRDNVMAFIEVLVFFEGESKSIYIEGNLENIG